LAGEKLWTEQPTPKLYNIVIEGKLCWTGAAYKKTLPENVVIRLILAQTSAKACKYTEVIFRDGED